jgi:hypothetical protein
MRSFRALRRMTGRGRRRRMRRRRIGPGSSRRRSDYSDSLSVLRFYEDSKQCFDVLEPFN